MRMFLELTFSLSALQSQGSTVGLLWSPETNGLLHLRRICRSILGLEEFARSHHHSTRNFSSPTGPYVRLHEHPLRLPSLFSRVETQVGPGAGNHLCGVLLKALYGIHVFWCYYELTVCACRNSWIFCPGAWAICDDRQTHRTVLAKGTFDTADLDAQIHSVSQHY